MACHHCHVEAGPKRTEIMPKEVVDRVIELIRLNSQIETVDITGGAPELNPYFCDLIQEVRNMNRHVIDRSNLSILLEPELKGLAEFLATLKVHIIASMPCYLEENVDKQRGHGAFSKSIEALKLLNSLGYGKNGSELQLDLVYNPVGAFLPPAQADLEKKYKEELGKHFGVEFHHLLTITNMPIKRFADQLRKNQDHDGYMQLLSDNFNPGTVSEVMCRSLISIGWDGRLYDCDFNQMLEIGVGAASKKSYRTVWDLDNFHELTEQPISTASHCFGCTAGAGSSCSGSLEA